VIVAAEKARKGDGASWRTPFGDAMGGTIIKKCRGELYIRRTIGGICLLSIAEARDLIITRSRK